MSCVFSWTWKVCAWLLLFPAVLTGVHFGRTFSTLVSMRKTPPSVVSLSTSVPLLTRNTSTGAPALSSSENC